MIAGMPDGSSELIKGNIGNIRSLGIDKHNRIFYQVSTALKKNMYVAAINLAQGTAIEAPKPVGQPLLAHHLSPTWSSDGKWLAYVCPQSRTEMLNPKTLCLWSVDGGQLRQVFLDKSLRLFTKMTWPVGGKYLFAQVGFAPTGLCTINPETGETVKIDVGPPPLDLFAWTPEGSVVFKNIGGFEKPDQRIIARNLKTGQETEIYHSAEACHFSAVNIPVSPDGKWLAFTRRVIEGEGMPAYSTLLLVSAGGGPVREILKLTNAGERPYTTGWSPDSKFLYYSIYEQDNKMWQVSVDGGKPTETSLPLGEFSRSFTELSFHPDGKRVAFVVKSSGPSEVWVMENFLQPKASASNAAPKAP
jgi:Tol biopolymer transport system component